MTWQSSLPVVVTIDARPSASTPKKTWLLRPTRQASIATCTPPSVAFLKPTGMDRPEASWRWTWLSVVRAPIAPQVTVSAMYCGLIGSRNSHPTGTPQVEDVEQQPARGAQAAVHVVGAVEAGVVDQALPAHRGARLLEVDPHDQAQVVAEAAARRRPGAGRSRGRPPGRAPSTVRPRRGGGRPRRRARRARSGGCGPRVARAARRAGTRRAARRGGFIGSKDTTCRSLVWVIGVSGSGDGSDPPAVASASPSSMTKGEDVMSPPCWLWVVVGQRRSPPAPPRASVKRQYVRTTARA